MSISQTSHKQTLSLLSLWKNLVQMTKDPDEIEEVNLRECSMQLEMLKNSPEKNVNQHLIPLISQIISDARSILQVRQEKIKDDLLKQQDALIRRKESRAKKIQDVINIKATSPTNIPSSITYESDSLKIAIKAKLSIIDLFIRSPSLSNMEQLQLEEEKTKLANELVELMTQRDDQIKSEEQYDSGIKVLISSLVNIAIALVLLVYDSNSLSITNLITSIGPLMISMYLLSRSKSGITRCAQNTNQLNILLQKSENRIHFLRKLINEREEEEKLLSDDNSDDEIRVERLKRIRMSSNR